MSFPFSFSKDSIGLRFFIKYNSYGSPKGRGPFYCIAIKINHLLCRWSPVSFSFKQETSSVIIGAGSPTALQITKKIEEYIRNQLQEDLEYDQMSLREYIDPFTGEPVKKGKKAL